MVLLDSKLVEKENYYWFILVGSMTESPFTFIRRYITVLTTVTSVQSVYNYTTINIITYIDIVLTLS